MGTKLRVVKLGKDAEESDLLVHDETDRITWHSCLSQMRCPEFPEPLGVIYADSSQADV